MKASTFDALTRGLATPSSRREAMRRWAALFSASALGGTALSTLSPGIALASGGNSDCAHFCNAIFAPGSARGTCKSDAAHGTGLCYTCGPKASGGTQAICCTTDSNGFCTSYSGATCCSSGQTCQSGTCASACPAGQTDCNGTCTNLSNDCFNCGACGNSCEAVGGSPGCCGSGFCICGGGGCAFG